jgi:hemin uptake protein HemP
MERAPRLAHSLTCRSVTALQMQMYMAVEYDNEKHYHLDRTMPQVSERKTLPSAPTPRRISSRELLAGERELVIVHNGREYRLRLTQHGKLILTA